eukprot:scaffold48096_cov33-Tisochrysis_lutea.AAC.9
MEVSNEQGTHVRMCALTQLAVATTFRDQDPSAGWSQVQRRQIRLRHSPAPPLLDPIVSVVSVVRRIFSISFPPPPKRCAPATTFSATGE